MISRNHLSRDLKMIRKVVWSYVRTNPDIEYEEWFAEACVIYARIMKENYDPSKSKKSTYIFGVLRKDLNNLLKRDRRRKGVEQLTDRETMETLLEDHWEYLPEKRMLIQEQWEEMVERFSPEAQIVCSIINEGDAYFPVEKPRTSRGIISRTLREEHGWGQGRVSRTFHEIKEAIR